MIDPHHLQVQYLQNISKEKKKTLWVIYIFLSLSPKAQTLGEHSMCAFVILYFTVSTYDH